MGMIFGWPYAMYHFKSLPLLWINTSLWKRLVRMVLGVAGAIGINYVLEYATLDIPDQATKFIFGHALPGFLSAFWVFGIFPIVCKWLHLVLKEEDLGKLFPGLASQVLSTNKNKDNSFLDGNDKASGTQLTRSQRLH